MKKLIRFLLIFICLISVIVLYARYGGTRGLITKEYTLNVNIDESFNGIKVVHFSDLHYLRLMNKESLKYVIDEINLLNADIVVFTGDLIDKDYKPSEEDINTLKEFFTNINCKYGKYAVLGNHDSIYEDEVQDIYLSSGFTLLNNDYDIIYGNNNDKLFIGGLGNDADIDKVMSYFDNNDNINYKIILVHKPDYISDITSKYKDINLVLSGHSHNGQINIPYIKKLFLPNGSKNYYDNYYKVENTDLYISSGIGVSKVNFRLFNKPSINFYRINKAES